MLGLKAYHFFLHESVQQFQSRLFQGLDACVLKAALDRSPNLFIRQCLDELITAPATWRRIGTLLDDFSPDECANYFVNSGYASV
jgi:hypothetical protein